MKTETKTVSPLVSCFTSNFTAENQFTKRDFCYKLLYAYTTEQITLLNINLTIDTYFVFLSFLKDFVFHITKLYKNE